MQAQAGILMAMEKQIRKPIITVLGHVDAGKTKLLDTIRGTAIAEKEAGGITQHIGATEVPIEVVRRIAGELIDKFGFKVELPGLLFIDTPGHEAFSNLRKRGGSIADLAVVVVDINRGLEKQTIEAIDILRTFKVPFICVANKIDALRGWETAKDSFSNNVKRQSAELVEQLDRKIYEIVGQLHTHGFRSERFDRIREFTKEVPIVPVCARSGEGIPEVLMFLAGLSQKFMEKELSIHVEGPGKGTVLEVKEEKGLGKTIDVILYDGSIRVGDEIVLGGKEGILRAKVRALLEPKPLDEIRAPQEKFKNVQVVHAASGVKIAAPGLDTALAGSPLRVRVTGAEEKEVEDEIQRVKIESDSLGPIARADTLGALEALIKLLEDKGIKIRKADVGEVSRRDVIEMEGIKEKEPVKGVIFAFHTKVKPEALVEAEKRGVHIFEGDVVYRLLEDYEKWQSEYKNRALEEKLAMLVFPARVKVLPDHVFRNSKPAVVGVRVLAGRLRANVEVMNAKGERVGRVAAIQLEGKPVNEAKEGMEVAVSIEGATVGRNLAEKDELLSVIPRKQFHELLGLGSVFSQPELDLVAEIMRLQGKEDEEEEDV